MASPSTPKSDFQQTVCLADWWLVKAETDVHGGNQIAVAGFTSREKQALRFFSSAPILKSYDLFTLLTTDGICVIIKGFINKAHTVENGFPSDVFNHFVFGFPPYWKEYFENLMGKESPLKDTSGVNIVLKKRLSRSQRGPVDKMKLKELDSDSVKDESELISEMPSLDKDMREVKIKGNMQKAKNRLSEKVKASVVKTRRKLAYGSPDREKEKSPSGSPQSLSLNRSRSGRLLMPTLEFWRNQRAIYNVDRTITGIEEEKWLKQTSKGSRSMPQRKRTQPV